MKYSSSHEVFHIIDGEHISYSKNHTIILWNKFNANCEPRVISMPDYVEEKSSLLRDRYAQWVHQVSQQKIQSNRIVDILQIEPNFSYWTMTPLAEKNPNIKSPHIADAIKVLALNELVREHSPKKIIISTKNLKLRKCISLSFKGFANIEYQPSHCLESLVSHLKSLRPPAQFILVIWLIKRILSYRPNFKIINRNKSDGDVSIITYFLNFNINSSLQSKYISDYWSHIPNCLNEMGLKINWLHINVFSKEYPNMRLIKNAFNYLDKDINSHSNSALIINYRIIIKAFKCLMKLNYLHLFRLKVRDLDYFPVLWPLFEREWVENIIGRSSFINLLYLYSFIDYFGSIPKQKLGLYLQENQGWEYALIYAWRKSGHGDIIGVPHASARFWDMRYVNTKEGYSFIKQYTPDYVAVNGAIMESTFLNSGYPSEKIIRLGALRYTKLPKEVVLKKDRGCLDGPIKILLLGDYDHFATKKQFELLDRVISKYNSEFEVIYKPHPACKLNVKSSLLKNITTVATKLIDLNYENIDYIYLSNNTTAIIDVYNVGLPLLVYRDPMTLNMSPLKAQKEVFFIGDENEFLAALIEGRPLNFHKNQYFDIKPQPLMWAQKIREIIEGD